MRKILIFLFGTVSMMACLKGQTITNTQLSGEWYACGLRSIQIGDTVSFVKKDSICKNADCLYYKWIIYSNGNFKSGWQEGCEETKIGSDLKRMYKCTVIRNNALLNLKKKNSEETYKILKVENASLEILRIK